MKAPAACGTRAGAIRHRREGTPVCRPCLDAAAAYMAEYRRAHAEWRARELRNSRARTRALAHLVRRHPQEYEALLLEALDSL